MRVFYYPFWTTTLAFLAFGCSKSELPDYTRLGGLRVLGVLADLPEVPPGTSVTITPVVSDLSGAGRTLSYAAVACMDPGVGFGAMPSCEGSSTKVAIATGTLAPAAPAYTEAAPSFTVNVPATVLLGRLAADQYNGVPYLVTYLLSASDGAVVQAFKRILVTRAGKAAPNQNPGVITVLSDGVALGALPGTSSVFSASFSGAGTETFSIQQSDGTLVPGGETLSTTWFLSDGTLEHFRTLGADELLYTPPPSAPVGHAAVIAVVTHDGRGGLSYRVYAF